MDKDDWGKHLTPNQFRWAIFGSICGKDDESFRKPSDAEQAAIAQHLAKCELCRRSVNDEKESNPIYKGAARAAAEGRLDEFWQEIQRLLEEEPGGKL